MASARMIRDPIHGDVSLTELEIMLLDSPWMQRLRNIKQNGFCFLVYPAMNSSRFEHSIGVAHLAGVMVENLGLDPIEGTEVRVAGLLHDVGHCAFSHTSDKLLSKMGLSHEKNSARIIRETEIADALKAYGIKPKKIVNLIHGRGELGKIISSEIDVDKMDYLIRDAYYAGVAYGVIDVERVIHSLKMARRRLVVDESGLEAVESLLISRNMMYQTVYRHHTKRVVECMVEHALDTMYDSGFVSKEEYLRFDDIDVVNLLRNCGGYSSEIMGLIEKRLLFKPIYQTKVSSLDRKSVHELKKKLVELENKIAADYRADNGFVFVDYPESSVSEFKIKVEVDGDLKPLDKVSSLARSLEKSDKEKLVLYFYAARRFIDNFRDFKVERYLKFK